VKRTLAWRRWMGEVLLVLAAPAVVVAVLAAATLWTNSRPQGETFQVTAEPQVVAPWQETSLRLRVTGRAPADPLPAVDLILVLDVSGSMGDSVPAMAEALLQVTAKMPRGVNATRYALLQFATEAEVLVPWTLDRGELVAGLGRVSDAGGGTDARQAYARVRELMRTARPGARRVVAWYTDGYLASCFGFVCPQPMTYDDVVMTAETLRGEGVDTYAVAASTGRTLPHPVLYRMAGPDGVFEAPEPAALRATLHNLAARVLTGEVTPFRIEQDLDPRHFTPLPSADPWRTAGETTLIHQGVDFPSHPTLVELGLEPETAGWWALGLAPASLLRTSDEGEMAPTPAAHRPRALVLTWWSLFVMLFPALLWAGLRFPRGVEEVVPAARPLPAIPPRQEPEGLPPVPRSETPAPRPVPSLFVGLGGVGGRALEAVRRELDLVHGGRPGPYRFLHFDLDRSQQPPESRWAQPDMEHHRAPAEVTSLSEVVPDPARHPQGADWFDAARYADAARRDLDLAMGARGDRMLARFAFFRWLQADGVVPELRRALVEVGVHLASGDRWQVVILAAGDGGFGGGTFIDWGRWCKRLGRELASDGSHPASMPEVVGLLVEDSSRVRTPNRRALAAELESAQAAGAHPCVTDYGDPPGACALDGEPAFTAVMEVSGEDVAGAADQAAQVSASLAEVGCRGVWMDCVHGLVESMESGCAVVAARCRALQWPAMMAQGRLRLDLLARIVGPDVLLDVELDGAGGVVWPDLDTAQLSVRIDAWAAAEPASPLRRLLEACNGEGRVPVAVEQDAVAGGEELVSWVVDALTAGVSLRLHGEWSGGAWRRGWMPGEAVLVLRELTRRLDGLQVIPESPVAEVAGSASRSVATMAGALESWLLRAADRARSWDDEKRTLEEWEADLKALPDRTLVRPGEDRLEAAVSEVFARWLGDDSDWRSELRRHLFPVLVRDGEGWRIDVHQFLCGGPGWSPRGGWSEALECLESLAERLTGSWRTAELISALGAIPDDRQQDLLSTLVRRGARAEAILVVTPRAAPGSAEAAVVDRLLEHLPRPAAQGVMIRSGNGDPFSIRRATLSRQPVEAEISAACSAAPECRALVLRRRLEAAKLRRVETFTPTLRLALSRPVALRRFAAAYQAGDVVRRPDAGGDDQWYLLSRGVYLTHGPGADLAAAAVAHAALSVGGAALPGEPADPPGDPDVPRGAEGRVLEAAQGDRATLAALGLAHPPPPSEE